VIGWVRARLRDREPDDAGMTLVELLVAMFVTSILLAGVATVFTGTLGAVRTVNVKTSTTADGRIAMEAITRTVRVAFQPSGQSSALILATTSKLSFYALLNRTGVNTATPLASLIEYDWDGTCITEAQTPGRTNGAGAVVWDTGRVSKCLARTSVAPSFAYYTSGSSSTPMVVPTAGLIDTDRQDVVSIQASVTIKDAANPSVTGVPVSDRITLINVQTSLG
jgi:prepilin-type N-terminal cleavage/methylation domain-containing protein